MTNTKQGQIQDFQRGGGGHHKRPEIFENVCL